MKRFLSLILMLSMILATSLLGCTPVSNTSESNSEEESISQPASDSEIESEDLDSEQQESESIEEGQSPKGILSLQEAFDKGVLTHEDLLNIAYHNGNAELNKEEISEDFEPTQKPEMTEEVTADIVKSLSYVYNYLDIVAEDTTENDFTVTDYLAFINGYYVLKYSCSHFDVTDEVKEEVIDGVSFEGDYRIEVVHQKNELMKSEAKIACYEWLCITAPPAKINDVELVVFGVFEDCLIGNFADGRYALGQFTYDGVLEYKFWHSLSGATVVWKDGEIARLSWAYKEGWITLEMVAQAHETYITGAGEEI